MLRTLAKQRKAIKLLPLNKNNKEKHNLEEDVHENGLPSSNLLQ